MFSDLLETNITSMNHIHLDKVQDFVGFALGNAKQHESVKVQTRLLTTSDEPKFYEYIEEISNVFLSKAGVFTNAVFKFLVLIHKDLSADLYINNFPVNAEISPKRSILKGEGIRKEDIADIHSLRFPDIEIAETDKVIYCFKVGWKFGLFFDLNRQNNLDVNEMYLALGGLYRYLLFQDVYKVLESKAQFDEMMKDGWFPFIEIVGDDYKALSKAYKNKFDFENRVKKVVDNFNKPRVEKITSKWWSNQIFKDKQRIIEAGINAYLRGDNEDFINCIKTLLSEIEGILRIKYFRDTNLGNKVKVPELLKHLLNKGRTKYESDYSLFLPLSFFKYLEEVIFANFNLEVGKVDLSRHSSSHGVAKPEDYTKARALQMILILDQIYFYIK